MNEQIRARKVRLIDEDGKQIGICNIQEALRIASEKQLDLVEVAPEANPPVCKLMDYGKYRYEMKKKMKQTKSKTKGAVVKEIRMRPKIEEHDYRFKLKSIREFLQDGCKVKVTMFFRGRELSYADNGREILNRVVEETKDIGRLEWGPKAEGWSMSLMLAPK
ncbi:MAG: translation initiation factor IF-3 [Synergistetes bacterium]|nr:translation initiation factor IF-3 [Synergistota bacterium]